MRRGDIIKTQEEFENLINQKTNKERVKFLVPKGNRELIEKIEEKCYYNGERKEKGKNYYEFFYFIRKYTYLMKTDYLDAKEVSEIFKRRGNWELFRKSKQNNNYPDFFYVDGKFTYDRNLFGVKSLLKNQVYNHEYITRKDELFKNLGDKKYLFDNYNLDIKNINYKKVEEMFNKNGVLILKPVKGFQGLGITIFDTFNNFKEYMKEKKYLESIEEVRKIAPSKEKDKYRHWVLQEYINNPLLVKGRKFHIRIYYLVYRNEAFVYNVGKIITAGEKYKREDYSNKKIHDSHITDSLQGMFFPESLKLTKKREREVWGQIIELFKDIKKLGKFECFPESKDCYQIFGADLMITDNYQVKMLELNTKLGFNEFEGIRFNKYLIENEMQTIVDNIFPPEKKQNPLEDKYFIKL